MRSWDGLNEGGRPWIPCRASEHCGKFGDRFATSIVYAGHTQTYAAGGLIIRPTAGASLNCAYASDGGSQKVVCDPPGLSPHCTPGCKEPCDYSKGWRNWGCSWPRGNLKMMLEQQRIISPEGGFNEVVLDAATWQRNLPRTVMAVFVHANAAAQDFAYARSVHAAFLRHYPTVSPAQTAFVEYNASHPAQPFRDISPVISLKERPPCAVNNGDRVPKVLCDAHVSGEVFG